MIHSSSGDQMTGVGLLREERLGSRRFFCWGHVYVSRYARKGFQLGQTSYINPISASSCSALRSPLTTSLSVPCTGGWRRPPCLSAAAPLPASAWWAQAMPAPLTILLPPPFPSPVRVVALLPHCCCCCCCCSHRCCCCCRRKNHLVPDLQELDGPVVGGGVRPAAVADWGPQITHEDAGASALEVAGDAFCEPLCALPV